MNLAAVCISSFSQFVTSDNQCCLLKQAGYSSCSVDMRPVVQHSQCMPSLLC